jgi:hypothetical protein
MLLDVGKIRLSAWRGAYRSPALAKTVAADFAEVAASTADAADRSRRRSQGSQHRGH